MTEPTIAFILPTYGHFDYARIAANSFFQHTPNGRLYLVDDASPGWQPSTAGGVLRGLPEDRLRVHRYPENGGLTRSWNFGLRQAREDGVDYVIAGNSDIQFSPGYYEALIDGVQRYGGMAGPLSNAPGTSARGRQDIWRYCSAYKLNDSPSAIRKVAEYLQANHRERFLQSDTGVNGFFQFSSLDAWWKYPFDDQHVYNPADKMVNQEDRLMGRWRKHGVPSTVCCGSFIFHYRSVSRPPRYRKRGWYRLDGTKDPSR